MGGWWLILKYSDQSHRLSSDPSPREHVLIVLSWKPASLRNVSAREVNDEPLQSGTELRILTGFKVSPSFTHRSCSARRSFIVLYQRRSVTELLIYETVVFFLLGDQAIRLDSVGNNSIHGTKGFAPYGYMLLIWLSHLIGKNVNDCGNDHVDSGWNITGAWGGGNPGPIIRNF